MAFTLATKDSDGSAPGSDRTVAPGATVTARFPLSDPAALGVVQFLSDMGAATISAALAMQPAATPAVGGD